MIVEVRPVLLSYRIPAPTKMIANQCRTALKKPVIAVFDFDGTLTHRDSFLPFVSFACTSRQMRQGLFRHRRDALAYVLGKCSNHQIKEGLVGEYFSGWKLPDLMEAGHKFATQSLPNFLNPTAMARLAWHQEQAHRIIIASANLSLYLIPWAMAQGINDVIATQLATDDQGIVTGKLNGLSCYGSEKVRCLESLVGSLDGYYLFCYGDSGGDRELLAIADAPFYRSFTKGRGPWIR